MPHVMDTVSQYLARRKGLLPLVGCLLVLCNLMLRFVTPQSWLGTSDLLLHLGILVAVFGLLLARVL